MKTKRGRLWIVGGGLVLLVVAAFVAGQLRDGTSSAGSGPAFAAASPGTGTATASLPEVTVYKSPTCGCCSKWADHLREAGFQVTEEDVRDIVEVKREHGVPGELGSCHTALVGDYVIEGHVPAEDIRRLLEERPDVAGLAVPGMPAGSPGMEVPGRSDPYASLTFDEEGNTEVWSFH